MNRAALARANLVLRIIPPRDGCRLFPMPQDYSAAISAIQELRGRRYVAEGAIPATALDTQGRHVTAEDEKSYHITLWNGHIQGCLRVRVHASHAPHFTEYRVYDLIRRMPPSEAAKYHVAMEQLAIDSLSQNYELGETGGWVVSPRFQANAASLSLPMAGWSLARIFCRQVWIAAATERNGSAKMLRRVGDWRLKLDGKELPPFHDPGYNCQMELLCFASDTINPKFEPAVYDLQCLIEEQSVLSKQMTVNMTNTLSEINGIAAL